MCIGLVEKFQTKYFAFGHNIRLTLKITNKLLFNNTELIYIHFVNILFWTYRPICNPTKRY